MASSPTPNQASQPGVNAIDAMVALVTRTVLSSRNYYMLPGSATSTLERVTTVFMHKDREPPDAHCDIWAEEIEPRLLRELGQAISSIDWLPEFVLASRQNDASTLVSSVLITCESRGTVQDIRNYIDEAEWLRGKLVSHSLALFIIRGRFGGLVADGVNESSIHQGRYHPAQLRLPLMSRSLCGQVILIGGQDDINAGYCTFGGTLVIGRKLYGLVARHPFLVAHKVSSTSADPLSNLGLTQGMGMRAQDSFAFNHSTSAQSDSMAFSQGGNEGPTLTQNVEGISMIGAALPGSDLKIIDQITNTNYMSISLQPADETVDQRLEGKSAELRNSDCILMDLSNIPQAVLTTTKVNKFGPVNIVDFWRADLPPSGRVSIVLPGNTSVTGTLQQRQSSFPIDGKFLRVYAINLENPLPKGSSGAWVVLASTLCGVIIGGRFDIARAYMVSSMAIIKDILQLFGDTTVGLSLETPGKTSAGASQEVIARRSLSERHTSAERPSYEASFELSNTTLELGAKKSRFRFLRFFLPHRARAHLVRPKLLSTNSQDILPGSSSSLPLEAESVFRPSEAPLGVSHRPDLPSVGVPAAGKSSKIGVLPCESLSKLKPQLTKQNLFQSLKPHEYQLRILILGHAEEYAVLCSADTGSQYSFVSQSELREAEQKAIIPTRAILKSINGAITNPLGTVELTFKISGFSQTWTNQFYVFRDLDLPVGAILGIDTLVHITPDVRPKTMPEAPPSRAGVISEVTTAPPSLPVDIRCWVQLSFDGVEIDSSFKIERIRWMGPQISSPIRGSVDRHLQEVKEAYSYLLSNRQIYFRSGSFQVKRPSNSLGLCRFSGLDNLDEALILAIASFGTKYTYELFELSIWLDFSSIRTTQEYGEPFRDMIRLEMARKMVRNMFGQKFMPPVDIVIFQQHHIIQHIIDENSMTANMDKERISDLSELVFRSATKLFLACVYQGFSWSYLVHLLEHHRYTDSNFVLDDPDCEVENCQFRRGNLVELRHALFPPKIKSADLEPQHFNSETIVPIYYPDSSHLIGEGAFGRVYKVAVHPDHPRLFNPRTHFALKEFRHSGGDCSPSQSTFYNELRMLSILRNTPNDHIVTNVAAFVAGDCQYILYPLAECNLRRFMMETEPPILTKTNELWFLHQLHGLATAIQLVHNIGHFRDSESKGSYQKALDGPLSNNNFTGFHHDLKPENILVFTRDPAHSGPVFKITDFGVGQVHLNPPNSWSQKTREPMGSIVYEAPDRELYGVASRPYDMWSLGCIFLELQIWLFVPEVAIGSNDVSAVETFSRRREADEEGGLLAVNRYWTKSAATVSLNPTVMAALDELQNSLTKNLRSFQDVLKLIRLLLQVQPQLRLSSNELSHELSQIVARAQTDPAIHPDFELQQRRRKLSGAVINTMSPSASSASLTSLSPSITHERLS